MPCMCGDTYCGSCGPAQGNERCPYCKAWSLDGGCTDPAACVAKGKAEDDAYAAQMAEELVLARNWRK